MALLKILNDHKHGKMDDDEAPQVGLMLKAFDHNITSLPYHLGAMLYLLHAVYFTTTIY